MTERVPSEDIEQIVGAKREPHLHLARANSLERVVHILHSVLCVQTHEDLRDCLYSRALDRGIDERAWEDHQDAPVVVGITPAAGMRLYPVRAVLERTVPTSTKGTRSDAIVLDEAPQFATLKANSVMTGGVSAMSINAPDGTTLLTVHPDGTWSVDVERAPEAARVFLDEMVKYSERIERVRHILTHDEPMMLGSIEQDLKRNPEGDGGEVDHKPSTPGWGGTGCPGRAFVVWRDRALEALDGGDPPVPGRY